MKKVNILLSTYNGEKYIEEQLESLFDQEYENIRIIIRDDGSTDGTLNILRKYRENYPSKVEVHEAENVGWKKSFEWLINHAGEADYYSFCDQDDKWGRKKVLHAVEALEKIDDSIPALYLSDFAWCDGELNIQKRNAAYLKKHSLEKFITLGDRNEFGFTETFNKKALMGMKNKKCLSGECPHDEVIYLYCLTKGEVLWGTKVDAKYRRYGGNASVQDLKGGNKFTHFMWRIKFFLIEDHRDEIYDRFRCFYRIH